MAGFVLPTFPSNENISIDFDIFPTSGNETPSGNGNEIICRYLWQSNTPADQRTEANYQIYKAKNCFGNKNGTKIESNMDVVYEEATKVTVAVVYSTVAFLCILGNLAVIFVVARVHSMRQSLTNFFIVNLAVADISVGIFCIIQTMLDFMHLQGALAQSEISCRLNKFVSTLSYAASVLILVVIGMERYLAIIFPMRVRNMKRKLVYFVLIIIVWLIAVAFASPALYYSRLDNTLEGFGSKCRSGRDFNSIAYFYCSLSLFVALPLLLMSYLYGHICLVLWSSATSVEKMAGGGEKKFKRKTEVVSSSERIEMANNGHVAPRGEEIPLQNGSAQVMHSSATAEEISNNGNWFTGLKTKFGRGKKKTNKNTAESAADARKKVIVMFISIVVVFFICKVPKQIYVILFYERKIPIAPDTNKLIFLLPHITFLMVYLSSAINPILYFTFSRPFRDGAAKAFGCPSKTQAPYGGATSRTPFTNVTSATTPN